MPYSELNPPWDGARLKVYSNTPFDRAKRKPFHNHIKVWVYKNKSNDKTVEGWVCDYCDHKAGGGVISERVEDHLAGSKGNVASCSKVRLLVFMLLIL